MAYFDRKDDYGYIRWASEVKRRDHYTCTVCGRRGLPLNAHHLNAWADYPDQRYDLSNGTCLCQDCHDKFHDIYGKGQNTETQFKEFEKIMEVLIKTANKEAIINSTARRMLQTAERDAVVRDILKDMEERYVKDGYQ